MFVATSMRAYRSTDPSDSGLPHKQRGSKSESDPDSAEHEHCHRCQVRAAAAAFCLSVSAARLRRAQVAAGARAGLQQALPALQPLYQAL